MKSELQKKLVTFFLSPTILRILGSTEMRTERRRLQVFMNGPQNSHLEIDWISIDLHRLLLILYSSLQHF